MTRRKRIWPRCRNPWCSEPDVRCPGSDEPLMKDGRCTHCGKQFSVRSNGKIITLEHEEEK